MQSGDTLTLDSSTGITNITDRNPNWTELKKLNGLGRYCPGEMMSGGDYVRTPIDWQIDW